MGYTVMRFFSRATAKSRRRFSADSLPYLVTPATIEGQLNFNPNFGFQNNSASAVRGMTITATPGIWADKDGEPVVVGRWMDWNLEAVGLEGQTSLTIPEEAPNNVGYGYVWTETATQNGKSELVYHEPYIEVILDPPAPQNNGITTAMSGGHGVGNIITRPVFAWWSPISFTVAGQWIKNGIPTGVITSTYSDTAEGDSIQWEETATNSLGAVSIPKRGVSNVQSNFIVSNRISALVAGIRDEVDTRIEGLPGGSMSMKVFNAKDHVNGIYEFNPNMWLYDQRHQMTGRAIFKGAMTLERPEDFGGILITPRHVLYCQHAHPHAANTWSVNPADSRPCIVRFVLEDESVVDAVQIHQYNILGPNGEYRDFCVATLDRDVQALGVHVMPISPYGDDFFATVLLSGGPSIPLFAVSQGYDPLLRLPWSTPVSDYPYPDHGVLCYIVDYFNFRQNASQPLVEPLTYQHFNFAVYDGDSGSPTFFMFNGVIYLHMVLRTIWGGYQPADFIDDINAGIIQSDTNAMNLGRLSQLTGLTVSRAPDPFI